MTRRTFLRTGALAVAAAGTYSIVEPHIERLQEVEIRLARLPEAFNGFRLVQFSDIHFGDWLGEGYFSSAMDKINSVDADAVLCTGDFITAHGTAKPGDKRNLEGCAQVLRNLRARHGAYGVIGNHDHRAGADFVQATMAAAGMRILRNQAVPFEKDGRRIWLCGVDDPYFGQADIDSTLASVPEEECRILMAHEPDFADELAEHTADLQLSGHTHGGQVNLPVATRFALPAMGRKYVSGLFHVGDMQLYVNRGLGVIGLPFRLFAPPEITVITLRSAGG